MVFYSLAQNFHKAEEKFHLLGFFYDHLRDALPPSALEVNIVSLRLIYLYSAGQSADYFALLESLPPRLRAAEQTRAVEEFAHYIDMGNYKLAFEHAERISAVHRKVLAQLHNTQRQE